MDPNLKTRIVALCYGPLPNAIHLSPTQLNRQIKLMGYESVWAVLMLPTIIRKGGEQKGLDSQ